MQCTAEVLTQHDKDGDNVLLWAAKIGHTGIVKMVLSSRHCTVEVLTQQDKDGDNALLWAVKIGRIDVVKAILSSRYCTEDVLNLQDVNGGTALDHARVVGNTCLVQMIEQALARSSVSIRQSSTQHHGIFSAQNAGQAEPDLTPAYPRQ
jgi:ankyrin repeat protein